MSEQNITNQHELLNAIDSVSKLLVEHGIDINQYGKGDAKTLEHLAKEVLLGESVLTVEDGELIRLVSIAGIDVLNQDASGKWRELYEVEQVFTDGRVRRRDLPQSLSEKVLPSELGAEDSVYRALKEELGLDSEMVASLHSIGHTRKDRVSGSYPQLKTIIDVENYVAVIGGDVQEHYQEVQPDKTTTWAWRTVE